MSITENDLKDFNVKVITIEVLVPEGVNAAEFAKALSDMKNDLYAEILTKLYGARTALNSHE